MSPQQIVWTALPAGRVSEGPFEGRLRVCLVASPRLTPPHAGAQTLGFTGFHDFHNWPKTVEGLKLALRYQGQRIPLTRISEPDPALWDQLLPAHTPVAGFVFQDMSQLNLRSYAVRHVLGFVREHYGKLATQAATTHPTLLPWSRAHGGLKDMLTDLGTATETIHFGDRSIEVAHPGFDRFFDHKNQEGLEQQLRRAVFGSEGRYRAPVVGVNGQPTKVTFPIRVLPPDWQDPSLGGADASLMSQFRTADEYTFYQANRFYKRTQPTDAQLAMRRPDLKNVAPAPKAPELDFHRLIASYGDTPQVLHALGLVIDCVLPENHLLTQQLAAQPTPLDGTFSADIAWPDAHVTDDDAYPATAWRLTPERFTTRARTPDHTDGLLHLGGSLDPTLVGPRHSPILKERAHSAFDVFQLDPDGATLKTTNYLLTAQNLVGKSLKPGTHGEVTYTTGDRQPVAALRSGGLGVSRHGRAAQIAQSAAAAALKNQHIQTSAAASRQIVLHTEDVLRGYRVDVQHQGKWYSLCQRDGRYLLQADRQRLPFRPDEGYVKGASTTSDGGEDHYLHEALFRWTGWSLVAPRPGRTIRAVEASDCGLQGESIEEVKDEAAQGNGLLIDFKAQPGTLPRLRFGHDYRFRARIVDLAGHSLALNDTSLDKLEQATDPVSYLRFEPVDPPALVHQHRVSEGESLERMVLRSNADHTPDSYLNTPDFEKAIQGPASADFEYLATNVRHVVPPKASQLQCEQHGLFDDAIGSGDADRIKQAYATAAREAGTLYDAQAGSQIELVTPASVDAVAQTRSVPPALPSTDHPTGERLVGGQYVLHREDQLLTPYLPDVAAGGFALRGMSMADMARIGITQPMILGPGAAVVPLPNKEELVLLVAHGKAWPDTLGLRIEVKERPHTLQDGPCEETFADDGPPQWDDGRRVLTLFLRKGHIARLRYASYLEPRYADHFGLPRWTDTDSDRHFVEELAVHGAHWMLTPYRALTLVHATQQPVCTPRLQKVTVQREQGSTHADLNGAVQLHGPSTGKFEVMAEWQEWIDDPQQPAPRRVTHQARLSEINLPDNGPNHFMLRDAALAMQAPVGNAFGGSDPTQRVPGHRHDFGDTRFRLVRYKLEATTRFREYLPPALYAQRELITRVGPEVLQCQALLGSDTDPGAPVLFNVAGASPHGVPVPSSAVPDVPAIVYVVPTFAWQRTPANASGPRTSVRLGNSLRVYLERPWFSSGDGELLGVVLHGDGSRFTDIQPTQVPYVTQWGLDPLFDSATPKHLTRVSDFPARVADATVPLLETGETVHVVGHRVQWDATRQLWYADIDLNTGNSYMPFVRLALVRYQPQALAHTRISRVVMADFAQLLPRRRAVLTKQGEVAHVTLHGPVPSQGPILSSNDAPMLDGPPQRPGQTPIETGRNKVELVLQTRDPAIDSDLAWRDEGVLASGLASPQTGLLQPIVHSPWFTQPASPAPTEVTRPGHLGQPQVFHTELQLPRRPGIRPEVIVGVSDPAVWDVRATVKPPPGRPARLVLREFERYYTDRTVPAGPNIQGKGQRRRVIEERLVYSEFFDWP